MGYKFGTCWSFLGSFFGPLFGHFLDHFWGPFWGPFSDQISQRGSKMSPRGPSRASKTNKATFSKKWFSRETVCIFSLLRPPKRTSRGPRRLPRGTQAGPKPQKKGIQKWTPKLGQKWFQNRSFFKFVFGSLFWGFLAPSGRFLAVFLASWGRLRGSQERKNADSLMRNPLFRKSSLWSLGAPFGSLGLLLASPGPVLGPRWLPKGAQKGA